MRDGTDVSVLEVCSWLLVVPLLTVRMGKRSAIMVTLWGHREFLLSKIKGADEQIVIAIGVVDSIEIPTSG